MRELVYYPQFEAKMHKAFLYQGTVTAKPTNIYHPCTLSHIQDIETSAVRFWETPEKRSRDPHNESVEEDENMLKILEIIVFK